MKKKAKLVVWTPPATKKAGVSSRASMKTKGRKPTTEKPVVWVPPAKCKECGKRHDGPCVQVEVFGRHQRIVPLKNTKALQVTMGALDLELPEEDAVPAQEFVCFDSQCVGVLFDGKVWHSWNCSWWKRPENKSKTPF